MIPAILFPFLYVNVESLPNILVWKIEEKIALLLGIKLSMSIGPATCNPERAR